MKLYGTYSLSLAVATTMMAIVPLQTIAAEQRIINVHALPPTQNRLQDAEMAWTFTANQALRDSRNDDVLQFPDYLISGAYKVVSRQQLTSGNISIVAKNQAGSGNAIFTITPDNRIVGRIETESTLFQLMPNEQNHMLLDVGQSGWQIKPFASPRYPQTPVRAAKPQQQVDTSVNTVKANASTGVLQPVDVLVLYTPELTTTGTPVSAILDTIFTVANQAYLDSGADIKVNMVHSQEINYTSTNDNEVALEAITNGQAPFAGVAALRNQHKADLVTLVRPTRNEQTSCGIAYLLGQDKTPMYESVGYSVVSYGPFNRTFCDDSTLVHEFGHNMGSAHDRANSNGTGRYTYSYGHGDDVTFGTVMSYLSPLVFKFSNPDLVCGSQNKACGFAIGTANEADNRTSLNNTAAIVAGFRASGTDTLSLNEALDNSLTWTTSGTGNWFGKIDNLGQGGDAAISPIMGDLQSATLSTTVVGPGTLTFSWRTDSEVDFDYLFFKINGNTQKQIAGSTDWIDESFPIADGSATLSWQFVKDNFVAEGADRAWLDNVQFVSDVIIDSDGDGVPDNEDAFPNDANEQLDTDGDGIGNNADTDDDDDGVADDQDAFPLDDSETTDTDNDGVGNNADTDDDNDGVADTEDAFPLNSSESVDTDGDGTGNNADTDDDNDGIPDSVETANGLNPLDPSDAGQDKDGDGVSNLDEFLAGTDISNPPPAISSSVVNLTSTRATAGAGDFKVLEFDLSFESTDVQIQSLTISSSGTGNEVSDVNGVKLFADTNNDGAYSNNELLATGNFTINNGSLTFTLAQPYVFNRTTVRFAVMFQF